MFIAVIHDSNHRQVDALSVDRRAASFLVTARAGRQAMARMDQDGVRRLEAEIVEGRIRNGS